MASVSDLKDGDIFSNNKYQERAQFLLCQGRVVLFTYFPVENNSGSLFFQKHFWKDFPKIKGVYWCAELPEKFAKFNCSLKFYQFESQSKDHSKQKIPPNWEGHTEKA